MAPAAVNSCAISQLRQLVYYNLDNHLLSNALFCAERLVAYDHSSRDKESTYLLALCHLRLGDNHSAYEYSKEGVSSRAPYQHLGCSFVHAQACLALEKYKDGISALSKCRNLWEGKNGFGKHTQFSRPGYPDAAAVHCLLGKLYYGYNDQRKAVDSFEAALKLNPFMWDAFTHLCDMGLHVTIPNVFKMKPEIESILKTSRSDQWESQPSSKEPYGTLATMLEHPQNRPVGKAAPLTEPAIELFNNSSTRGFAGGIFSSFGTGQSHSQKLGESNSLVNLPAAGGGGIGPEVLETPTGPSASIDVTVVPSRRDPRLVSNFSLEPPQAPARKTRTLAGSIMDNMEAPKMRGVSKRAPKPSDQTEESAATQALRGHHFMPIGGDRKRTVSGQVVQPARQPSEDPGAPQRRSARLNPFRVTSSKSSSIPPSIGPQPGQRELKKPKPQLSKIMRPAGTTSTVGRQVSGNRIAREDSMDIDQKEFAPPRPLNHAAANIANTKTSEMSSAKQEEGLRSLLELFSVLGSGYFALSHFQCQAALEHYKRLSRSQQDTPWVMAQMGRAHYEQAAYAEAETYYKRIRQKAPTRFADMEIYSTILWHLKRETDLAFLAHELVDSSWQSPQAWCALGNSWSLARDHEQALRCFRRATQLNPKFAYAFTLQGHEYVANEEYEKAQTAYRQGISADPRHYNAWYGVGRVYEKLGNFAKASEHYSKASRINPTNAVLICCIGTILEKQHKNDEALSCYTQAAELAPRSALTRFKKARVLMEMGQLEQALQELLTLKDLAPDEAMVHFLLGRLYKQLRQKRFAVKHFTISLNLDPKASQQIKEAIESMEDDDYDDETTMVA